MSREKINNTYKDEQLETIVQALEDIQNSELIFNNSWLFDEITGIIQRLKDKSFKIAVVGEFSSGKSTFLNALVGKDLLKHGVKETTATITEIHNDPACKDNALFDVYFLNGDVQTDIPIDRIADFTSTTSIVYEVAQEIEKVVVRAKFLDKGSNVYLIDTPGLNGVADKHREKTIEQIRNAHACIYMMQIRGLSKSDLEFIKYISKYQNNIIFVQNFIDDLKRVERETPEEKICEQKRIIDEIINSHNLKNIRYKIVGISARKALIAREQEFVTYNGETLTKELRERLYKESRIKDIINSMNDLIEENEKNRMQQRDTLKVSYNILLQLKQIVPLEMIKRKSEWENTSDGINMQNYKELLDHLKANHSEEQKKINNYIEIETDIIKKSCRREIEEKIDQVKDNIEKFLKVKRLGEFEEYISISMPNDIYFQIIEAKELINSDLCTKFKNLINNTLLKTQENTKYIKTEADIGRIKLKPIISEFEIQSFPKEESKIDKLEREINERITSKELDREKIKEINEAKNRVDLEIENNYEKKIAIERQREDKVKVLGPMPEIECKKRTEIVVEERQGLSKLLDIFKRKTIEKEIIYYDETKREKWKKEKEKIEDNYRREMKQIEAKLKMLENDKAKYDQDLLFYKVKNEDEKEVKLLESKINHLAALRKELEEKKAKAKIEYLESLRNRVKKSVEQYLENVEKTMTNNFDETIKENKENVTKIVSSLFEISYNERVKQLEAKVGRQTIEVIQGNADEVLKLIEKTTKEMEDYLCLQ